MNNNIHKDQLHKPVKAGSIMLGTAAIIVFFFKLILFVWGAFGLWFQAPIPWRMPLILCWCSVGIISLVSPWTGLRNQIRVLTALVVLLWFVWWQSLTPLHARDWADDVANLLEADIEDDHVVLRNVRNFEWRSETDYTPRWENREYDLNQLVSADLLLSYWMGPAIAHTLVSFGFSDGRQLVFSLEIRKEQHESFSAIAGFFRQYETVIIAADENDIVRVRTNARGETVHLYRLALGKDALRSAFLAYLYEAEMIRQKPRFYNTLTSNCTTIVFKLARQLRPGLPMDYRLLVSGYFAEYAYDQQGLMPGYSYSFLQEKGDITSVARAFQGKPERFSSAIRQNIPDVGILGR